MGWKWDKKGKIYVGMGEDAGKTRQLSSLQSRSPRTDGKGKVYTSDRYASAVRAMPSKKQSYADAVYANKYSVKTKTPDLGQAEQDYKNIFAPIEAGATVSPFRTTPDAFKRDGKINAIDPVGNAKLESIGQVAKNTYESNSGYRAAKEKRDALDRKVIEDEDMIMEKGRAAAAALTSVGGVHDEATRERLLADVRAADDLQAQRKAAANRAEGFKNEAYVKAATDEIKDLVSTINNDKDAAAKIKAARETEDFKRFADYAKNGTRNAVLDALDKHGANILGGYSAKDRNATITDDELSITAYLIGDGQKDRAKRYLKDIVSRDLDARASKKHLQEVRDAFGGENATGAQKVGAGIVSVLTSPQKMFGLGEGIAQSIKNAATGGYEPINTNSMFYAGTKQNRELRGLAVEGLDGVAAFAANTAMSIGDTLMTLPFGGAVAPAIMAGETISDSTLQAAESGATTEQATALGLANGAAAYVLEKVGIDNLFATKDVAKQLGKNGFKEFVRAAGQQAVVEGAEELGEEAIDILADIAILGDKGEVQAYIDQYLAEHPNSTQAQKDAALAVYVLDRLGRSALGGVVSGGVLGGGAQMIGNARYKSETRAADRLTDDLYVNMGTMDALNNPIEAQADGIVSSVTGQDLGELTKNRALTVQAETQADAIVNNAIPGYVQPRHETRNTAESAQGNISAYSEAYTDVDIPRIRKEGKTFRNIIAGIDTKVSDFFNKWKDGRKSHAGEKLEKLYLGKTTDVANEDISNILGYDVDGRDFIITNDDVKHILDRHGPDGEATRNGYAEVTPEIIDMLPEIVKNPDNVYAGSTNRIGKQGVVFEKVLPDGNVVYIQFDNPGRGTLQGKTIYIKKDTTSGSDASAETPIRTSETTEPVSFSTYTIPQTDGGVNRQNGIAGEDTRMRRAAKSMLESPNLSEDAGNALSEAIERGEFQYVPVSNKTAIEAAREWIAEKGGVSNALSSWLTLAEEGKIGNKTQIAQGEQLLAELSDMGDTEGFMKLAAELAAEGTRTGQMTQAFSMIDKLTPQGRMVYVQRQLANINREYARKFEKQALKNPEKAWKDIKLSKETADAIMNAKSVAELNAAEETAAVEIAQQLPSSMGDKLRAWRYLSMLGNLRTHARNIVGNAFMRLATNGRNLIATGLERAFVAEGERTKAVLTPKDRQNVQFAKEQFEQSKRAMLSDGKYGMDDVIDQNRKIFNTRWLEFLRTLNNEGLEGADAFFMKGAYANAFAQMMKARGYTRSFLESGTKAGNTALQHTQQYATRQALETTFREYSKTAAALNNLARNHKGAAAWALPQAQPAIYTAPLWPGITSKALSNRKWRRAELSITARVR